MNILFVTTDNIFSTCSSNIRNVSMISGFLKKGHNVDILTFSVDKNASKYDPKIENFLKPCKFYFVKNHSMQKVFALKKAKGNKDHNFLKLFLYRLIKRVYLKFCSSDTLMNAVKKVKDIPIPCDVSYDCVVSSSDPISSHYLAKKYLLLHKKTKWIQYWGDPLFADITRINISKKKSKQMEQRLLKEADKIVYTNAIVEEEQKKVYQESASKMIYVPTPFVFVNEKEELSTLEYDVGYFGSYMSCIRNIYPLCEACDENQKKLIIMGGGDQTIPASDYIHSQGFQGVDVVTKAENSCHILACICNDAKGKKCLQIPGKIYHYAITYKYILVIGADEKTKVFLSKFNRFVFADNDKDSISAVLKKIESDEIAVKNAPPDDFCVERIVDNFLKNV